MKKWVGWAVVCVALTSLGSRIALADKPFSLVEEAYPEAKGQLEYENTFSLQHTVRGDSGYWLASNESELEYGVTENFTLRAKGAWYYEKSRDTGEGTHFDDGGLEGQYFFTNPNTDAVGLSVISAVLVGEHTLSSENFLVAQKDFDKWIVAGDFGLAAELEGVGEGGAIDTTLSLSLAAGIEYQLLDKLRVGVDAQVSTDYFEFLRHHDRDSSTLYVGPTLNWRPTEDLWLTAGFETEVLRQGDAPRYQLTLIVGYYF